MTLEGEISRLSSDLKLISEIHSITMKKINDHEERVRLLERRVWALPSAATVIAGAALVVPFIT
nr:hypothetical protein [uncultured bacterium]AMP54401.1 hypothetical protein [uncultured bacterium]